MMKPLIKNLMYPVFCATFTENFCSAFETASQLLEVIKNLPVYHLFLLFRELSPKIESNINEVTEISSF